MKIRAILKLEEKRQQETIDLIPSENIASKEVRDALGSMFVNKYAEGYPGRRYYPGNALADRLESTVQKLALRTFHVGSGSWQVNVQPYSGSPANAAVYLGLLNFSDTIMGLNLTHGGHLTHGHRVSFSGRAYHVVHYGVGENGYIDYAEMARLAQHHHPKIIISGATAYPRRIDFAKIGKIATAVKAWHMADVSHIAGLIAAGVHPSPFPHAHVVTATTHKTLRGPRAAVIFARKELASAIDRAVFPGLQGGPHLNQIAALGVALEEAQSPSFKRYQKSIVQNAKVLADELMDRGFALLTGGTDNHLLLIDLRPLNMEGAEAEKLLDRAGILANRNTIPNDPSPFRPSGLRLGTPAVSSRGMVKKEMQQIATWIGQLLLERRSPSRIAPEVRRLCKKFPITR